MNYFIPIGNTTSKPISQSRGLRILSDTSSEDEDGGKPGKPTYGKLDLARQPNSPVEACGKVNLSSESHHPPTMSNGGGSDEGKQKASKNNTSEKKQRKRKKTSEFNAGAERAKQSKRGWKRSARETNDSGEEATDKDATSERDANSPSASTKRRRSHDGGSRSVSKKETRLHKLRKCAHQAGIFVNYKKLFDGLKSVGQQVQKLESFLEEKGLEKPITLEKCRRWKLEKENEREIQELSMDVILTGDERGGRLTRSRLHETSVKVRRKSTAVIEEEEDEEQDQEVSETTPKKSSSTHRELFASLASIVSSDESESND